jgi:hypothetical protein
MKYTVVIEETMEAVFKVEADNEEQAKEKATEMQENGPCEWEVTNTDINIGS